MRMKAVRFGTGRPSPTLAVRRGKGRKEEEEEEEGGGGGGRRTCDALLPFPDKYFFHSLTPPPRATPPIAARKGLGEDSIKAFTSDNGETLGRRGKESACGRQGKES